MEMCAKLLDMDSLQLAPIVQLRCSIVRISQRMEVNLHPVAIRDDNTGAFVLTSASTCHSDIKTLVDVHCSLASGCTSATVWLRDSEAVLVC